MFIYMPQRETAIMAKVVQVNDTKLVVTNGYINLTEEFDSREEATKWLWKICKAIEQGTKMFYVKGKQPGE